ncbi:polysaccharide biosynthesis/export family protein [Novosphingobium sp. YAF33]|uniref:polysaccharide biosynthesis/export family protein n=1 Tax=Novosphingobium sp. YAF33 TaxID=3233082 RepID=UPI003F991110
MRYDTRLTPLAYNWLLFMKKISFPTRLTCAVSLGLTLSACANAPGAGPSTSRIVKTGSEQSVGEAGIKVIDVTDAVTREILANSRQPLFSEQLGEGRAIGSLIGKGDVLDIAIWEAPPAALFGASGGNSPLASSSSTARGTSMPEQMVDSEGQITIPFVGRIQADGRTPQEIARAITGRLVGLAHQPQVIVRLVRNAAANVTVVGDVAGSARVPLTARGERVLDVLATAGGVRQPVNKMTIQITRGMKVASLPLETVIRDPQQNVRLQPDDVMTVLYQPYSFTALGAVGRNDELPFEATGLTLAQALGRISGLQDTRADVKGVFIFRLENPDVVSSDVRATARTTPNGKIPVIYRISMKDASSFFIAQSFPIQNKDVLYVSNAPLADIQKFVNVIYSTLLPVATTATAVSQ